MLLHPGKCCGWTPVLWVHMVFTLWDEKSISLSTQRHIYNCKGHFLFTTWKIGQHSCLSEGKRRQLSTGLWGDVPVRRTVKIPWVLWGGWCSYRGQQKNQHFFWFLQWSLHFQYIGFCTVLAVLEDRLCLFSANKSLTQVACRSMATGQ